MQLQHGTIVERDPALTANPLEADQPQTGREQGRRFRRELHAHRQGQHRQALLDGLVRGVDEGVILQIQILRQVEGPFDGHLLLRDEMSNATQQRKIRNLSVAEIVRNPKEIQNPKSQYPNRPGCLVFCFLLRFSDFFRISDFGFRISGISFV